MKCEADCKPWIHYFTRERIYQSCEFQASVEIDGVALCLTHAGAIAVRKLINEGMAKRLEKTFPGQNTICKMDRF